MPTLPTSGAISLGDLQNYLEGVSPGTNPSSITEYYANGTYVTDGSIAFPGGVYTPIPTSGQISLRNFYGAKWLGGITYEYTTPGTYTVTIPKYTGTIQNYECSGLVVGGGGGGGGGYVASSTNGRSGGGGGGGCFMNASISSTPSSLSFTVVIGAGGTGGISSETSSATTRGTKGANTTFSINGTLQLLGEGGGPGGNGVSGTVGTAGTSTTSYPGASPSQPGIAGVVSSSGNVRGGAGGDTFLAYGSLDPFNGTPANGIYGSGGHGGGGNDGTFTTNGGDGGSGYARITFKNDFTYTTSQSFTTPTSSGTFTVPAGIYQIYVASVGAGGNTGAAGGYTEALITVTPSETLTVRVGGTGNSMPTGAGTLGYTSAGINGGGRGYRASGIGFSGAHSGGGYSGLFRGATPLLIAGGGGGGSGSAAGGALANNVARGGATPGTQSAGGSINGASLTGGDGFATGAISSSGGGGGGGYFGGGGGTTSATGAEVGGAGGSNYPITSGANSAIVYSQSGYNLGGSWVAGYGGSGQGGQVIIYY